MVTESRMAGTAVRENAGALSGREASQAVLLAANLFLLLAAYYVLKTVREALILTEGGAEIKSYAAAVQAVLLLAILPGYGLLTRKISGARLAPGVTLFFILQLVVFSILGAAGVQVGRAFFLWVGVFVLIIAQCWALAADLVPAGQGKRVFWIVGFGGAAGAWAGAWFASHGFAAFGPYRMMLVAAAMLFGCMLLGRRAGAFPSVTAGKVDPLRKTGESPKHSPVSTSRWSRYFLLIALLTVLLNVVSSTGEYILGKLVMMEADRVAGFGLEGEILKQAFVGQFYARFFGWANLLGVLLQLLFVPLILRRMCAPSALFILPAVALAGYGVLAAAPLLGLVQIAKVIENGADYSIQSTARHALFLPASREWKYQGQTAIETLFARAGDLLHALVVFVGSRLAFDITTYAAVNLVLTMAALAVVATLYRENRKAAIWE